jgi:hypothetical protein
MMPLVRVRGTREGLLSEGLLTLVSRRRNTPKGRFSATLGQEPEIAVALV